MMIKKTYSGNRSANTPYSNSSRHHSIFRTSGSRLNRANGCTYNNRESYRNAGNVFVLLDGKHLTDETSSCSLTGPCFIDDIPSCQLAGACFIDDIPSCQLAGPCFIDDIPSCQLAGPCFIDDIPSCQLKLPFLLYSSTIIYTKIKNWRKKEKKMSRERTISARMHQAYTLLTNIQQPDLRALVLTFGFDDLRLADGQALYDNAKILISAQKGGYASQFQATRDLENQAKEAEKIFADNVILARRAFNEEKTIKDLGINGSRKKSFGQWTDQAHNFYGIALQKPGIMSKLSYYGVTPEIFQANQLVIDTLRALSVTQKNMIGNAQVATERKDEALN
jgi:hypothetical protein